MSNTASSSSVPLAVTAKANSDEKPTVQTPDMDPVQPPLADPIVEPIDGEADMLGMDVGGNIPVPQEYQQSPPDVIYPYYPIGFRSSCHLFCNCKDNQGHPLPMKTAKSKATGTFFHTCPRKDKRSNQVGCGLSRTCYSDKPCCSTKCMCGIYATTISHKLEHPGDPPRGAFHKCGRWMRKREDECKANEKTGKGYVTNDGIKLCKFFQECDKFFCTPQTKDPEYQRYASNWDGDNVVQPQQQQQQQNLYMQSYSPSTIPMMSSSSSWSTTTTSNNDQRDRKRERSDVVDDQVETIPKKRKVEKPLECIGGFITPAKTVLKIGKTTKQGNFTREVRVYMTSGDTWYCPATEDDEEPFKKMRTEGKIIVCKTVFLDNATIDSD